MDVQQGARRLGYEDSCISDTILVGIRPQIKAFVILTSCGSQRPETLTDMEEAAHLGESVNDITPEASSADAITAAVAPKTA